MVTYPWKQGKSEWCTLSMGFHLGFYHSPSLSYLSDLHERLFSFGRTFNGQGIVICFQPLPALSFSVVIYWSLCTVWPVTWGNILFLTSDWWKYYLWQLVLLTGHNLCFLESDVQICGGVFNKPFNEQGTLGWVLWSCAILFRNT